MRMVRHQLIVLCHLGWPGQVFGNRTFRGVTASQVQRFSRSAKLKNIPGRVGTWTRSTPTTSKQTNQLPGWHIEKQCIQLMKLRLAQREDGDVCKASKASKASKANKPLTSCGPVNICKMNQNQSNHLRPETQWNWKRLPFADLVLALLGHVPRASESHDVFVQPNNPNTIRLDTTTKNKSDDDDVYFTSLLQHLISHSYHGSKKGSLLLEP